jgi:hypothetical protein
MAFVIRDLSVLQYANGFTHWVYQVRDAQLSIVYQPNYFKDAADMMKTGDVILVTGDLGALMLHVTSDKGHVLLTPVGA